MDATPGNRYRMVEILLEGTGGMPGCLSYVVALDPEVADRILITEVWKDRESHVASLQLPAVQEAIGKVRPLLGGFGERRETVPVGGVGVEGGGG